MRILYTSINESDINIQRMKYKVISKIPIYSKNEKEAVKINIEKQLFEVFKKYI